MRNEQSCTVTCHQTLDAESAKSFKEKIDDEYRVNMWVMNILKLVLSYVVWIWVSLNNFCKFFWPISGLVICFWFVFYWALKLWIELAGFWITFQLLFLDKGGMEANLQHMNTVFVLGSKENIKGYNLLSQELLLL